VIGTTPDFGVWVKDPKEGTFLVHGSESIMREIFGNIIEEVPMKLVDLSTPKPIPRPRQRGGMFINDTFGCYSNT
jgi:hypothetical protein